MSTRVKHLVTVTFSLFGLMVAGCTPSPAPDTTPPVSTQTETPTQTSTPTVPPVPRPSLSADFVSRIDGSTVTIPLMTTALQLLRGSADGLEFNKTDQAYENLIAGEKDVIFVTAPSSDELASAQKAGVTLDVIPVVNDAMVFLVNTANQVDNLTSQQVKDIYSGKITNWSQVGGADQPIVAYQRQVNSGSQTMFLQLVMGDTVPMTAPQSYYLGDMGELIDKVAAYDNTNQAIGYSFFYYAQEMHVSDNVNLVSIDGVAPSPQTIADGSYPYITSYFAVMRSDEPADSPAKQLVDWCLSAEGQQTFSAASYVPLDPSNVVEPVTGYGYEGSTAENTTQSSGTGGPVGTKPQWTNGPDPCQNTVCWTIDDQGNVSNINFPGHAKLHTSVAAWLSDITSGTLKFNPGTEIFSSIYRDLLTLDVYDENSALSNHWASFRIADGHHMALSDFFYDGVNYIDFINRTLLNEGANQNLYLCDDYANGDCSGGRAGPFTGLPADTTSFAFNMQTLIFTFPDGNPFITTEGMSSIDVSLNLPYDLSPYGITWQVQQTQVGGRLVQHVVSNYASVNPHDAQINQTIDNWAAKQKGNGPALVNVNLDGTDTAKSRVLISVEWSMPPDPNFTGVTFDWDTCQEVN